MDSSGVRDRMKLRMKGEPGMSLSSKTISMKRSLADVRKIAPALAILLPITFFSACGKGDLPAYETNADREYMGSVYYAKSDCVSCHGAEWNGKGADAARVNGQGFKVTDFTAVDKASKTPADYFMAVTDPKGYFKGKKGVGDWDLEIFVSNHQYLTYTDKARWMIANFLYGLGTGNPDSSKMAEMKKNVSEIYGSNRRWEIGFPTVESRNKRPDLKDMIQKTGFQASTKEAPAKGAISESRMAVAMEKSEIASMYKDQCAGCHGNYAEGVKGTRYGLTGMIPILSGYPRVGDGPARQNPVDVITGPMGSMGLEAFKSAHTGTDLIAPNPGSLTDAEWQDLHSYTMRLAGN